VPHFVLQPLVENAIEHGIARRAGAGRIAIAAQREGEQLVVTVRDNGVGLANSTGNEGTGLGATRQRLRELYGEHASLALTAIAAGGVEARLVLPYHEQAAALAEAAG
jgi:LytS/YehU family sensor histidine kinase